MSIATTITASLVQLPGRVALDVVDTGDPAGTPVVLLHGITDSWRSWELALAALPASLRAIAITQRGHGDSERPAAGYRTRDFAGDVAALLDVLELPSAVVVGHSMGSIVARRFAIDHPERTRGLALVGSFGTFAGKRDIAELTAAVAALTDPIDQGFVRDFQESTVAGPVPPAFFETIVAESCKMPVRVFTDALAGLVEDDAFADLGRVAAPTLVAWGDRDAYCPRADQDAIVAAIPGARLSVYAGVGHSPHWEQPARFARELAQFVAEAG
jgi:pimeloyl-ACP methyl ester carboxylesterase